MSSIQNHSICLEKKNYLSFIFELYKLFFDYSKECQKLGKLFNNDEAKIINYMLTSERIILYNNLQNAVVFYNNFVWGQNICSTRVISIFYFDDTNQVLSQYDYNIYIVNGLSLHDQYYFVQSKHSYYAYNNRKEVTKYTKIKKRTFIRKIQSILNSSNIKSAVE